MIANGHRLDDIKQYTFRQVKLFLQAISEEEKHHFKMLSLFTRASTAPKDDYKNFLKSLDE